MSYITKGYLATQLKNLSNRISEVFAKKTDVDSALNRKSDTGHTHTKSDVGLGYVDNTADVNKSVKYAVSAGSATEDSEGNVISEKFNTLNENEFAIWDTGSYEISGYYNTSSGTAGRYVIDPSNGDICEVSFITVNGATYPQWKKVGTGTLKPNAVKDGNGNNIVNTYATKKELENISIPRTLYEIDAGKTTSFNITFFDNRSYHIISSMYTGAQAYYLVLGNYSNGGSVFSLVPNSGLEVTISKLWDGACTVSIKNNFPYNISVEVVII